MDGASTLLRSLNKPGKLEHIMNRRERRAAKAAGHAVPKQPRTGGPGVEVLNVSAWWRNDKPGGIGVGIEFASNPGKGVAFCRVLESQLPVYDRQITVEEVLDQLSATARRRDQLTDLETMVIITNIYWLQERGRLRSDEFNGVVFTWTTKGTGQLAIGEQNPLFIDTHKAVSAGIDVTEIVRAGGRLSDPHGAAFRAVLDHARDLGRK